MAKKVPFRLKYLRVNPHAQGQAIRGGPCNDELQALLTCWRQNGVDAPSCLASVGALAACSSAISKSAASRQLQPSVNFVLNKMFRAR
jgi:hypothetical protein